MQGPQPSDTFVVLQPLTLGGHIIFGKNSGRPSNEVQEVVLIEGGMRPPTQQCTHIIIEQSPFPINTVILSKPAWMWGAEMGANDKNVVIGNEAVWTKYNQRDGDARVKRLLGTDLVRLGLERGNNAENAVDVITSLLEKYGQGGPCTEDDEDMIYHNSFIIADSKEAWVLETSGKFWAAEKISSGYRNISNVLSITTKIDKHSEGLQLKAMRLKLWNGKGKFNFKKCFGAGGDAEREVNGDELLSDYTENKLFEPKAMMHILRRKDKRICRGWGESFPTMGSQVSRLSIFGLSVHYFTATPDTSLSFFKPFMFTPNAQISEDTCSPINESRQHILYQLHAEHIIREPDNYNTMEIGCLENMYLLDFDEKLEKIITGAAPIQILDTIMKDCVQDEIERYAAKDPECHGLSLSEQTLLTFIQANVHIFINDFN